MQFQILCSADLKVRKEIEQSFDVLMRKVIEIDTGRLAYVCYGSEFSLPAATMGPMIIDPTGKPTILSTLDQRKIPAGHYIFLATNAERDPHLQLGLMRALVTSVFGKAAAYHSIYQATIQFSDEPKLGFATNAFEVPQKGFWSAFAEAGQAEAIAEVFLNGGQSPEGQAAVSIFLAALDQSDLSAKLILFWSAMETLASAKRLANTFGHIYGCSPQHLDEHVPFDRLKRERDDAAHRGKRSTLSQADERILQGMFVDVLGLKTLAKKTRFGPELALALRD
jgi:hypothetical protein